MSSDPPAWPRRLENTPLGTRYRLYRLLGVGGMGAVYEAVQLSLDKRVAVKLLAPHLMRSADGITRFQREAKLASSVAGRHVLEMLDFEIDPAAGPFIVMEYLYGESVDGLLARVGRMELDEACDLMTTLLDTLAIIHAQGVVHRDLKPSNLFFAVTPEGDRLLKVLDFGLSRLVDAVDSTRLTAAGRGVGTPWYAAPEQIGGHGDHRVDVYACGVVLYECLAGTPPYIDDGTFVPGYTTPIPLDARRPDLRSDVIAVVHRAMSRDPDERFANASAMSAAIRSIRATLPTRVGTPAGASHTSAATATELEAVAPIAAPIAFATTANAVVSATTTSGALAPAIAIPTAPARARIPGVVSQGSPPQRPAPAAPLALVAAPAPIPVAPIAVEPAPAPIAASAPPQRSAALVWVGVAAVVALLACVVTGAGVVVWKTAARPTAQPTALPQMTPIEPPTLAPPTLAPQTTVVTLPPPQTPGLPSLPPSIPTSPFPWPPPTTRQPETVVPNTDPNHRDLQRAGFGNGIYCARGTHVLTGLRMAGTLGLVLSVSSSCNLTCIDCTLTTTLVEAVSASGSSQLRFERSTIRSQSEIAIRMNGNAQLTLIDSTVSGRPAGRFTATTRLIAQRTRFTGGVLALGAVQDLGGNTGFAPP